MIFGRSFSWNSSTKNELWFGFFRLPNQSPLFVTEVRKFSHFASRNPLIPHLCGTKHSKETYGVDLYINMGFILVQMEAAIGGCLAIPVIFTTLLQQLQIVMVIEVILHSLWMEGKAALFTTMVPSKTLLTVNLKVEFIFRILIK